jgi:hypothetical protein
MDNFEILENEAVATPGDLALVGLICRSADESFIDFRELPPDQAYGYLVNTRPPP